MNAIPDSFPISPRLLAAAPHRLLFLGRGALFPIALEGALKLKEISYIHAEGYAAGEMKHGPIALIDETVPVVVVAPTDAIFDKTASNFEQAKARGGGCAVVIGPASEALPLAASPEPTDLWSSAPQTQDPPEMHVLPAPPLRPRTETLHP